MIRPLRRPTALMACTRIPPSQTTTPLTEPLAPSLFILCKSMCDKVSSWLPTVTLAIQELSQERRREQGHPETKHGAAPRLTETHNKKKKKNVLNCATVIENTQVLPNVAFKTPEGRIVLIVANDTWSVSTFNIQYRGQFASVQLRPGAVGTYVW